EATTSKLAVASVVCTAVSVACAILVTLQYPPHRLAVVPLLVGLLCLIAAFSLGYAALEMIKASEGLLTGKGLAIAGMTAPAFCIILVFIVFQSGKPGSLRPDVVCGTNLSGIAKAMLVYANDANDNLPEADKWCDLLVGHDFTTPKQFVCKSSDAVRGESSYAFNRNLVGRKFSEIPGDVVLLFETNFGKDPAGRQEIIESRYFWELLTRYYDSNDLQRYRRSNKVYKLRWNQNGGPEILTTENHDGEGCNVAFVDTHVEFVRAEEFGNLKWTVEDSEKGPNKSGD
ncbi:MAG: hypothetical protein ACYSUC_06100, partial [Planctomycetota bacterium]